MSIDALFTFEQIALGIAWFLLLAAIIAAISFRPLRKSIGLCMIIVGTIVSLTGIGIIIGIPMIVLGGVFFFI